MSPVKSRPAGDDHLVGWVDRIAREQLVPIAEAFGDRHEVCRELVAAMGDCGLLGLTVPTAYGGDGFDERYSTVLCEVRETLSYHHPLVDFTFGLQGLGTVAILRQGSDEQRQLYLPDLVAGRRVFAFALTEPHSGSDVLGMRTRAHRTADGFVIDGRKTFISGAPDADVYVVFARTGEAARGSQLTAFAVERDTPGLSAHRDLALIAPHAIGSLDFDGCAVGREQLIGEVDRGLRAAFGTLEVYRPSVGALSVGAGRRAMEHAWRFAREREAFGQTLLDIEAIRLKLARGSVDLAGARALVYHAAALRDDGMDSTMAAAMAKLRATEVAHRVVYEAQQIHGGRGVLAGTPVEVLARHTRQATVYEGTSEIQRSIIGRRELTRATQQESSAPPDVALPMVREAYERELTLLATSPSVAERDAVRFRVADVAVMLEIVELLSTTDAPAPFREVAALDAIDAVSDLVVTTDRQLGGRTPTEVSETLAGLRSAASGSVDDWLLEAYGSVPPSLVAV